jgi:hypothetical protein
MMRDGRQTWPDAPGKSKCLRGNARTGIVSYDIYATVDT